MKLRHQRTDYEFVVLGPCGAVEMSLLHNAVIVHTPAPDDDQGAAHCPLLEMRCDAPTLSDAVFARLLTLWLRSDTEAALFAALETIYTEEFK